MLAPLRDSGAVKISLTFAEAMGEEISVSLMRKDLEGMVRDAHLYMKRAETSLDLTKDPKFRSVMRVVGPLLRALPPDSDLGKAMSVTSKLKQFAAAEAVGSLYYGSSIRTTLEGLSAGGKQASVRGSYGNAQAAPKAARRAIRNA